MPFSTYRTTDMGTITCLTPAPVTAGAHATLRFRFTTGPYGIDDTGGLKISWRQTSDMGKPQIADPAGEGFARIESSPGRSFRMEVTRDNLRPWKNTLYIRVGRFLLPGESFELVLGCTAQGGPGLRVQTNAESGFAFKTFVDAFATYDFVELENFPRIDVQSGPAETYRAVLPTEVGPDRENVALRVVGLDRWGNPTMQHKANLTLVTFIDDNTDRVDFMPDAGKTVSVVSLPAPRLDGELRVTIEDETGATIGRSNPAIGVAEGRPLCLWGDLHGQSGETVGSGTLAEYFAFAEGPGLLDAVCHQGNDFQMTDADWQEVNRLTHHHDASGRFVALPGYEWSGNTGVGGDHNVIYQHEGETIHRSSSVLLPEGSHDIATEAPTVSDLFAVLDPGRACVIAHVGGRYAMIRPEDDLTLQRAVEVHSCWGTFEWILHDAFEAGQRIGIVAHSDDHKGRPGCAWPGASTFGALGGLTCYLTDSFDRQGILKALRDRHTYGTTGNRIRLDLTATAAAGFRQYRLSDRSDKPLDVKTLTMGDIATTTAAELCLEVDIACPSGIERIDLLDGTDVIESWIHPAAAPAATDRIRVMAEGALYRGRGRHLNWAIDVALDGTRITATQAVNVFNRNRIPEVSDDGRTVSLNTVTTGNRSGMELSLSDASRGTLNLSCDLGDLSIDLSSAGMGALSRLTGEGLGRQIVVQRLPGFLEQTRVRTGFKVALTPARERRLYLRVTQEDGHVAWSSPIYLERKAS